MKIQVTQQEIDNGTRQKASCCPVALAVSLATQRDARVTADTIRFGWKVYITPEPAASFIEAFDAGEPVSPFEFELELA